MTLVNVSPDACARVRPSLALLALAALAALFIPGFSADTLAQSVAPRPVARMIGSSGPRPMLASPARCAARTNFVAASSAPAVAPNSSERRAFELVNEERRARGQEPLVWDAELTQLARRHSENMARRNFFSHTDPEGLDTADRAAVGGVCGWRAIAENIAYNQGFDDPVGFAVERWMQSPKHRENILRPVFTHAGIGVSRGADGRVYFTQVFVAR
ncbi:MAG TPA: CAP domain-containing protein [Pyrinomonadaceae bacterium]|nr:CAP domain-containing protein [Pyrinomonadaceae bacterium]